MPLGTNTNVGCCLYIDAVVIGETFTPFHLEMTPIAGGAALIEIDDPPTGVTQTWMFISTTTIYPRGAGPFLGIVPDGFTVALMALTATPQGGLGRAAGPGEGP